MPRNGSAWRSLGPVKTRNRPSFSVVSLTAFGFSGGGVLSTAQPASASAAAKQKRSGARRMSAQNRVIVLAERRCGFREGRALAIERQGQADQFELAVPPLLNDPKGLGLCIGDDLVERIYRAIRDTRRFKKL